MKLKVKVPTELKDIRLSQYQRFMKMAEEHKENEEYLAVATVAIFCDITDKQVRSMPINDFNDILSHIEQVFNVTPQLKRKVSLNGVKYGFIPKLDEISLDELADADSNIEKWDKMQEVMAVLYRPIKDEYKDNYTIEEYDIEKAEPLDLSMDVVFGAIAFFLNLRKDLEIYIQSSITVEVERNRNIKRTLEKNGDGIRPFMLSLREILGSSMKSERYEPLKPYYFYALKRTRLN